MKVYPSFTYEELIIDWFKRSQGEKVKRFTIFDQFISLWFAFNSWGTYRSRKDRDRDMLRWVKRNTKLSQILEELIERDHDFADKLRRLSQYRVYDMRPGRQGES